MGEAFDSGGFMGFIYKSSDRTARQCLRATRIYLLRDPSNFGVRALSCVGCKEDRPLHGRRRDALRVIEQRVARAATPPCGLSARTCTSRTRHYAVRSCPGQRRRRRRRPLSPYTTATPRANADARRAGPATKKAIKMNLAADTEWPRGGAGPFWGVPSDSALLPALPSAR